MTHSQEKPFDKKQKAGPGSDDPVLAALSQLEARYWEVYQHLNTQAAHAQDDLVLAGEENERLTQQLAAHRLQLDQERRRAERQHVSADTLAAALNEVHRA